MSKKRYKYPRTSHLPWSPGGTDDDLRTIDVQHFEGKEVLVTEKMDGENTTLYTDHLHARSLDSRHHPSRDWVKAMHSQIAHEIPKGWRICGENVYAKHAIAYDDLVSYFLAFSMWNEDNVCLPWDETIEWFEILNLSYPRIFYQGPWSSGKVQPLLVEVNTTEGYVVRVKNSFQYEDFNTSVAKWVRKSHVQTGKHWMHEQIIANKLST